LSVSIYLYEFEILGDFYYSNGQQQKAKQYYLPLSKIEGISTTESSRKTN
tara:strand:+ start:516 stop:665 length:150 start_codon:yes stop_codon:yes gene_type:complete